MVLPFSRIRIGRFMHSMKLDEMGVLFQQNGFWSIGGLGHFAMIVKRGGTLSELMEQGCLVSSFEPGSVIRLSPWLSAFLYCVILALQHNAGA